MSALKDFTELHDAIEAELRALLPQLDTVALYDPTDIVPGQTLTINTPAVLIELTEATPGRAITGGRIPWKCEIALHCILSKKTDCLPLAVRNLAAMVAQVVSNQHRAPVDPDEEPLILAGRQSWGLGQKGVEPVPIDSIAMYPGAFKPGKGGNDKVVGYDSMIITFDQAVHLGDLLNDPPEFTPGEIKVGGPDNMGAKPWN